MLASSSWKDCSTYSCFLAAVVVQYCEVVHDSSEHHPMEVGKVGGGFLVAVIVLSQAEETGFAAFRTGVVCAFEHVVES